MPSVAVIVALPSLAPPVKLKVAVICPCGTVTVAGSEPKFAGFAASAMVVPPVGAG